MKKKYYQLTVSGTSADLNIYGDITSWPWMESDVSAFDIKAEIDAVDVDTINVYINSYGGEVAEALAIYSALKRHKASVKTYCDGFACSAATIIFAAGDERVMSDIGLLMIHNAWTCASGNAEKLRKAADDIETVTQSSVEAYKKILNISENEIKELMNKETWITAQKALEMGFATSIAEEEEDSAPTQSVKQLMHDKMLATSQKSNLEKVMEKLDAILAAQKKGDDPILDAGEENPDDPAGKEQKPSNAKAVAFFNALK